MAKQKDHSNRNEQQLALWRRWRESGDDSHRQELLETLQPLVRSHLAQYATSPLPYEVLELQAYRMLRDALPKYNPERSNLGTFASHSLRPLSRYVQTHQNTKYLPQYLAQQYGRYENEQRKLRDKLGRDPDDIEMAKAMNLPARQIRRIRLAKSPEIAIGATERQSSGSNEASDASIERERIRDKLYYLRTTLRGKDREIFDYLTGMGRYKPISSRAEIARRTGVPIQEVYAKTRRWARLVR